MSIQKDEHRIYWLTIKRKKINIDKMKLVSYSLKSKNDQFFSNT